MKQVLLLIVMTVLVAAAFLSHARHFAYADVTAEAASSQIDKVIGEMKINLSLTDKQADQLRPILERDMKKRTAIKNELDELDRQTRSDLGKILTDEQMQKLQQAKENNGQQDRGFKGGHGFKGSF